MPIITNYMLCNTCFSDILTKSLQCTHCLICVHQTCAKLTMTQFNNLDNLHLYCKDSIEFSPGDTNDDCLNITLNVEDNEDDNKFFNKCTATLKLAMFNFDYDSL